jgi:DNA polymerase II large subunit
MNEQINTYFGELESEVKKVYALAEEARKKGFDPVQKVEIPLAMSMAEKVVGLISTIYPQMMGSGISERILELEKEYGKLDLVVVFKIAEEVAKQNFCKFNNLIESIDAGIRVGFAYTTLGVVSSPIEGFTGLKIGKTKEGKEYFVANFSGPIRSAGTTASCVVLILIDYLREMFGYAKYDPSEEEIKRVYTELADFHERITNLQYMPTEAEAIFLARNLPIQIAGDASERLEVSNYKNLERVDTNFLRSGVCLILGEGLAQKAAKGFRLLNMAKEKGIKSTGFDFLKEYIELHEKRDKGKTDDSPTYIKDLVAGRPVFGHPSRSGSFRFRYGRGRASGFSAASVHPATMAITDNFIAIGTQLKIEKPTKGCAITVCDSIDGPIVKLINGSVKKINSLEEAKKIYPEVEEIIYLGDILFPISDLANRNAKLIKPGYVEEWWKLDLREKNSEEEKKVNCFDISFEFALELSRQFGIPLHPKYIFYWTQISREEFLNLLEWIKSSQIRGQKIVFPFHKSVQEKYSSGKRALELLGAEHEVTIENVVLTEKISKTLFANLGLNLSLFEKKPEENITLFDFVNLDKFYLEKEILEIVNNLSEFEIKDKAGEFIGARMGRPEKAKLRKLTGSPNTLFPVGNEGGRLRSIQAACETGRIRSTFPLFYCERCKSETIYPFCETCGGECKKKFYFFETKEKTFEKISDELEKEGKPYCFQEIDINSYLSKAKQRLNFKNEDMPSLIKGIRGTSSEGHLVEHLSKGILRAKYGLQVNKDGTIRFDATELPLISFKPKEVLVSVDKLRELGYKKDIFGKELISDNQILELMPHDILLPSYSESLDEKADDVFIKTCNFVDDLLIKFYNLNSFYNVKSKEDLIGKLGVCMAPHNCAGVICRFIGFSNTLGLFASPYMHAAIRRDCDGDEAAIMLLGDVLLNFSRKFLPSHRGGTQDAPLVLNAKIDAGEVDDQILDFEFADEYPLELYRLAEQKKHSSEVKIYTVKKALKEGKNSFIGFGHTHDTENFNSGVPCSSYKLLGTMSEKVQHQMRLVEKLRSVDTSDTARLMIERHFLRDMRGNLRKFSMQGFRCVGCNEIMRRPPLTGVCPACGGKIIFTIHEGGIKKYLDLSLELAEKYNLPLYLKQTINITKENIDSIFGKELEKQESLGKWF